MAGWREGRYGRASENGTFIYWDASLPDCAVLNAGNLPSAWDQNKENTAGSCFKYTNMDAFNQVAHLGEP